MSDKLLVLLAIDPTDPISIQEVKARGAKVGWAAVSKFNVSQSLSRTNGRAIRTNVGWELTDSGQERVAELLAALPGNKVILNTSKSLRTHLAKITDALTRGFVEEAVICFEAKQYRAAVVFSWAGAVAMLHKHVFDNHIAAFNADATARFATSRSPWRAAKQQDDLCRMGESDFLIVCEAISVPGLGKNVRDLLQNICLKLRNTCGHPNSAQIAENSAAAHIEKLILNVFTKF
jgi:hypothetical protein